MTERNKKTCFNVNWNGFFFIVSTFTSISNVSLKYLWAKVFSFIKYFPYVSYGRDLMFATFAWIFHLCRLKASRLVLKSYFGSMTTFSGINLGIKDFTKFNFVALKKVEKLNSLKEKTFETSNLGKFGRFSTWILISNWKDNKILIFHKVNRKSR